MRKAGIAALVVVLAAAGLVWQRGGLRPASRPRSVLLISVDTLRADRLGSYGHSAAATPVLDALAARGLRFTDATTTVPLTLPAHTSLLTGTFPTYHGVRDNGGFYVDDSLTTLAETVKPLGYRTGGFVAAFVLDRRWGIAQGFDYYFDDFDLSKFEMSAGLDAAQRPGKDVVDRALAWLAEDRERPFLAWVHLYDPHSPYTPPEPYRSRFPATAQGAYDGEVAYTDAEIGRLLSALEASGQLDSTLVVVVGDHGESLGEHGEQQHGFFVYDAAVHIPLIIAGPGVPARTVTEQVRIVDVMPTVLDLLGVTPPEEVQGQSLTPLGRGEALDLLAYSETYYPRYHYGWSELTAVRDGRFKFIAAPRRELYDVEADPGETKDLSSENPRMAEALERGLRDLVSRTATEAVVQQPRALDPDTEQRLRALGYVASTVSRAAMADTPRSDPKDTIRLYNLLKRAAQDSVDGNVDAGIARVREVLAVDPEVIEAHTMLGNMLTKAGRPQEAIAAYQRALAVDPEHEGAAWSLALAYKDAGKEDEAKAGFERVLQLNPRGAKPLYQLADIAVRNRDLAGAVALLEKGLTLDADRAAFLVRLAEVRIELNQMDAAHAALTEAIGIKPDQAMAHYNLALVYEARRNVAGAITEYEAEIASSPMLYQPHFNLARLLAAGGRVPEALAHFKAAVDKNPEFGTGYLYLAKTMLDAGDLQGAEQAAQRGLKLNPDPAIRPLGHFVLADVYAGMGRDTDARRQVALGRRAQGQGRR
jgi:arylsulfatase A-like enzyme/cytochrome c-type biogenesis protein CcmH/NrfG